MDIVFNVNPLGLEGLGATLTSLIRHCSNTQELKLWFLCSEFKTIDRNNINKLLQSEQFRGTVEYVDFDAKAIFGHYRSLHGDWTPYGRLLIADYIKNDVALYLDADLIVLTDVLELNSFEFNGAILAAVYGSTVAWALESSFFLNKLNWSLDRAYFNSGVVFFNLKKWREANVELKWKSIAEKYPNELLAVDQTLLNAVCEGNFAHLLPSLNVEWPPQGEKPKDLENSILHFVGSPKPWDFLGRVVHQGHKTWHHYNTSFWEKEYSKTTFDKVRRTWKIKKSILRLLKNKLKSA